jgi:hypothetical protein
MSEFTICEKKAVPIILSEVSAAAVFTKKRRKGASGPFHGPGPRPP